MWKDAAYDHALLALMPKIFVVEDQSHAEAIGKFSTLQGAWDELLRLSAVPWDAAPNMAPCQSWKTCGRDYEIIEYDITGETWTLVQRYAGLEVGAEGVAWGMDALNYGA